jgi:D-lactate dehydrogenase
VAVCEAAGFSVRLPERAAALCCGLAFESKGFAAAAQHARARAAAALTTATGREDVPVVTDASPCAAALAGIPGLLDFPSFWARHGLPQAPPARKRTAPIVLHPTCSTRRTGGLADLLAVARAYAEDVRVPLSAECCGFAGDRGIFFPEVTDAALRAEALEIGALVSAERRLYSTSRTCEMGLRRATGVRARSLVHLVHEALFG